MSISRVYRILRLITLLQSGQKFTAAELAEELQVSRRTVFRDLNMLEMAHIPYYFDEKSGSYRISEHFFLPPVNLTLTEALAVLMLTGRLRGGANLPLMNQSARAAMKLESVLPKSIREHVGSIMDRLSFLLGPTSRHEGLDTMFDDLAEAAVARTVCRLVYISFYERKQVTLHVHPLRLVFHGRAWYLIAWSERDEAPRTYKLARIRKLTVTKRTFDEHTDVDLENYFGDAWGMIPEGKLHKVHLHFEPKVAGNVAEVRWHASQQVEFNDDGSAEFRVTVDGLGEITWWILGYGDQVEVVAPVPLRKRVAAVARAVAAKYRKEGR